MASRLHQTTTSWVLHDKTASEAANKSLRARPALPSRCHAPWKNGYHHYFDAAITSNTNKSGQLLLRTTSRPTESSSALRPRHLSRSSWTLLLVRLWRASMASPSVRSNLACLPRNPSIYLPGPLQTFLQRIKSAALVGSLSTGNAISW
jgi:hypothetical protein